MYVSMDDFENSTKGVKERLGCMVAKTCWVVIN